MRQICSSDWVVMVQTTAMKFVSYNQPFSSLFHYQLESCIYNFSFNRGLPYAPRVRPAVNPSHKTAHNNVSINELFPPPDHVNILWFTSSLFYSFYFLIKRRQSSPTTNLFFSNTHLQVHSRYLWFCIQEKIKTSRNRHTSHQSTENRFEKWRHS